MRQLQRIDSAHVIRTLALAVLLSMTAGLSVAQNTPDVRLENQTFDWTDAREDSARFAWSADVINETSRDYQVRVILELLDDDDRVINRDERGVPSDVVLVSVEAGSRQTIRADGEMPYDLAAEIVSIRYRRELVDSSRP
jgi:hypothetical protein